MVLWIKAVELGGFDQAVDDGGTLATSDSANIRFLRPGTSGRMAGSAASLSMASERSSR